MESRDAKLLSTKVLSIECGRPSSSRWEDAASDTIQKGDIVEELQISSTGESHRAPFKTGRAGIQKVLRAAHRNGNKSVLVRVKRYAAEFFEVAAEVIPQMPSTSWKENYVLRSISDRNFVFWFTDRTEADCLDLQGYYTANAKLQDEYKSYPWDRRMFELLSVSNSSRFFSILFIPKGVDDVGSRYNDLEDTLARANTWLVASHASGVPIKFFNIQTEPMLTKISGDSASPSVNAGSLSDLCNVSLYGFEDYHGVDIGVIRTVRLWFSPAGEEVHVDIKFREREKFGFTIERTEEGFIYINSVDDDESLPPTRSKLSNLFKESQRVGKLLIVSRVSNEKVLPWMIASRGTIRCYDVLSLREKLCIQRDARETIRLHVFYPAAESSSRPLSPNHRSLSREVQLSRQQNLNVDAGSSTDGSSLGNGPSFSFHSLSLSDRLV